MKLLAPCLTFCVMSCASTGPVSQPAPAGSASADRQAVIAVAEQTFAAMRSRDTSALRRLLDPDLVLISLRTDERGVTQTRRTTVPAFLASIARAPEELVERMWDPKVEISGDLASLWAPYDFHVGGRFSHCGVDAFDMIRSNGAWRVVGLAYTAKTSGCTAPPR